MATLDVRDLEVEYFTDIRVLRGLSLRAPEAQITSIIGPNGAGKSTLLKTIYGYLRPRAGKIFFNGADITGEPPYHLLAKGIAFVPQDRTVFPDLTVHENLEMGAWLLRKHAQRVKEAIDDIYRRFPVLGEKRKAKAQTLSGGQQRMLELGRALLTSPQVLLIDEPTVGLAPKVASEIYTIIADFRRSGITILLVDQNVRRALELADYVYLLEMGVVREHGPKAKFLEQEATLRALYIGGTRGPKRASV
jgi:branched-chain amino acid transport system ATP-binding protein